MSVCGGRPQWGRDPGKAEWATVYIGLAESPAMLWHGRRL